MIECKYTYQDKVEFKWNDEIKVGYIEVVDRNGTIEQQKEPSYDIMADNGTCLYKHILQSLILHKIADDGFVDEEHYFKDNLYNLNRFIDAQKHMYKQALEEVKNGRKITHWMWFIFPQIDGLGMSYMAMTYAIKSKEELELYMKNDYLRNNILELSAAILELDTNNSIAIFGEIDSVKLRSSMTLFAEIFPEHEVFQKVLDKFYYGYKDPLTLELLQSF